MINLWDFQYLPYWLVSQLMGLEYICIRTKSSFCEYNQLEENMQECPNCKEKTISNWYKVTLGTGQTLICKNCGAKLTVPRLSVFHAAVFVIPGYIISMRYTHLYPIAGLIMATSIIWYIFKVGLVEK